MPSVEVVVPLAGDCSHRLRAWEWCSDRLPLPPIVADPAEGPWVKALAVMPAVLASTADVIVMADADVWVPNLPEAVEAVQQGMEWAVPHRGVHRLTREGTAALYSGSDWATLPLDQNPYLGVEGGGALVARREVLIDVPLDPRFIGWGSEDESWGVALRELHGPPWRPTGHAPLIHLWHPPQARRSRARGSAENWALRRRYMQARNNSVAMRRIVKEADVALNSHLDALHDHPPVGIH